MRATIVRCSVFPDYETHGFSHPRRYMLKLVTQPRRACPHARGVSSRILASVRSVERVDGKTSIAPSSGVRRRLKPTYCRASGLATALLA